MPSSQNPLKEVPFYGILDTGYVTSENWEAKFAALAQGGAAIIQVRAKNETAEQRESLLKRAVEARASLETDKKPFLVINDDVELCLKFAEIGLHIGQDDTPATEARAKIGPDRVLGLSTHSIKQAQTAINLGSEVLSYFAVGPVFATQTKPDYTPVGLELVKWVSEQQPELPFFCIGGIKRSNIDQIKAAGAKQIVTVSDALCDEDTAKAVKETITLIG